MGARREEAGGGRRGEEGSEEGTYFVLAASSSKRHDAAEWREGGKRGRACARGWRGGGHGGRGGGVVVGWCVGREEWEEGFTREWRLCDDWLFAVGKAG